MTIITSLNRHILLQHLGAISRCIFQCTPLATLMVVSIHRQYEEEEGYHDNYLT